MKRIFLAFLTLLPFHSFSQSEMQDVLYLKDGSIIRGIIREHIPDSIVKISIMGGNVLVFSSHQISSITIEAPVGAGQRKFQIPAHGYFNITELGFMPATNYQYNYWGNYNQVSLGFTAQTINGYRFKKHFLVGAGAGVDLVQQSLLTIFGEVRWEILSRRATPFVYADVGYDHPLGSGPDYTYQEETYSGGQMTAAGAGMRFNFRNEGSFIVSMGYKQLQYREHIVSDYYPFDFENHYTFNRVAVKVGLGF